MANPLLRSNGPKAACRDERLAEAREEALHRGNAFLASIGRHDLHWYIHKDQLLIGFKWAPGAA